MIVPRRTAIAPAALAVAALLAPVVAPASAATPTNVKRYTPYAADGTVRDGLKITPRSGECWTRSYTVRGAWRCMTGNLIRDPCFAPSVDDETVVCAPSPWARSVIRIHLTEPLPDDAPSPAAPAWWIQLAGGQRCGFVQGASGGARGMRLNYVCDEKGERLSYLYGEPRRGAVWRINRSRSVDGAAMRLAAIRTVWR